MKTCSAEIHLTKEGHSVVRSEITPAELLILVAMHHANSGGKVIGTNEKGELLITPGPDVTRTPAEEKARLRMRYAGNVVESTFPGASPNMPDTFKAAYELGLKTVLPASKMSMAGQ